MNKKLLGLYGLKFNPFSPELPASAFWVSPPIESFCRRIEQQIGEGGFALAVGDTGTGKSFRGGARPRRPKRAVPGKRD